MIGLAVGAAAVAVGWVGYKVADIAGLVATDRSRS